MWKGTQKHAHQESIKQLADAIAPEKAQRKGVTQTI